MTNLRIQGLRTRVEVRGDGPPLLLVNGLWGEIGAFFLAGLMLVIAGAAMVLVFAPKGHPPAPAPQPVPEPEPKPIEEDKPAAGETGIA